MHKLCHASAVLSTITYDQDADRACGVYDGGRLQASSLMPRFRISGCITALSASHTLAIV